MKRVIPKILSVLLCGFLFLSISSCTKDENIDSVLNIKAVNFQTNLRTDTTLLNGVNIEWYNASTSEIKFKDTPNGNYFSSVHGGLVAIIFCLDEVELFKLDAISSVSSVSLSHPVLIKETTDVYYIGRGYPNWEYWKEDFWKDTSWDKAADWVKNREQNWKAIEAGWNKFIEQLKKEGKYRK